MNNSEIKKTILEREILPLSNLGVNNDFPWNDKIEVTPIRIAQCMERYNNAILEKEKLGLKNTNLFKTMIRFYNLSIFLKENPTFIIVESIDFSHGYEYMATIENSKDGSLVSVAPIIDSEEMQFFIYCKMFKKIDSPPSKDETLSIRKYKLED